MGNLGKIYSDLRKSILDENGKPLGTNCFAEKIGLASSRISELENNKREMSLTELKAYHKFFNVSFEYLLGETETKSPEPTKAAAAEYLELSDESIEAIKKYPYKVELDDLFETEFSINGLLTSILQFLNYTPEHNDRYVLSKNGDLTLIEQECYNIYGSILEFDTKDLVKDYYLSKINSRLRWMKKYGFVEVKELTKYEEYMYNFSEEMHKRDMEFSKKIEEGYEPLKPFRNEDIIDEECEANGKHNPPEE